MVSLEIRGIAEVYSFMEKNKNVHWYCDSCNKGVAAYVIEEVSKLKLRLVFSLRVPIENNDQCISMRTPIL